jgi:Uma2 family endonuclease
MKKMSNIVTILSPEELSQIWAELGHNDQLPDWYELTEHGELIMSPKPGNRHQVICAEIAYQLRAQLGGKAVPEAAVLTSSAGVRVPDIVWMPEDKWQVVTIEEGLVRAPEFVVEVLSPGNRHVEINYKVQAYLASGIQEVLVVGLNGSLQFYRQDGVHTNSSFNVRLSLPPNLFQ